MTLSSYRSAQLNDFFFMRLSLYWDTNSSKYLTKSMSFSCNNHQIITFVSVFKVFRSFQEVI